MHGQKPLKPGNQQKPQGGQNSQQMMRANIAEESLEDIDLEHAFNVTTSFNIADITVSSRDSLQHMEVYDSGASCHMSPYISAFTDFTFINPKPISAADNRVFNAVGKETMRITIPNSEKPSTIHLREVLYAPTIAFTLISLSRTDSAGYTTVIKNGDLHLLDHNHGNKVIRRIPTKDGLWCITQPTKAKSETPGNDALSSISLMDIHQCLGCQR